LESHSQPPTDEEQEDLVAPLTQKQRQQEQEKPVLLSIENHDLQEIVDGIDSCLQRLSNTDPGW
jgi:hypothetical protein